MKWSGAGRGELARVSLARVTKLILIRCVNASVKATVGLKRCLAKWLLSTLFRVAILIISSEKGENAGKLIQIS